MEAVRLVVRRLADARLVTTSLDKGEESVQIIHDSLIREWARLQRWLKKDRAFLSWDRELEKDAREWREISPGEASGLDEGRLLRGRRLEEAEKWLGERERDLGEGERELVQASLGLREREREKEEKAREERERTRRRIIQGVMIFSIYHESNPIKRGRSGLSSFHLGSFLNQVSRSKENLNRICYIELRR